MMLDKFIYNEKNNFIFAYIPKVACTNFKCILRYLDGHANYLDAQLSHNRELSGLRFLSSISESHSLLIDPSINKLTCVRNPYTRILSAYLNKIKPFAIDNAPPQRDPYFYELFKRIDEFRINNKLEESNVSFNCFLEWLEISTDPLVKNEHWISQTSILGIEKNQFSYIGRFERLATDGPELLKRMKCDIPFPTQDQIKFPSTHASELTKNYYCKKTIERVRKIYADDFRNFNYDSEILP